MSPAVQRPRKTVEDYPALPDDGRAELIDGELYVTPSPVLAHQRILLRLLALLQGGERHRPYLSANSLGQKRRIPPLLPRKIYGKREVCPVCAQKHGDRRHVAPRVSAVAHGRRT